MSYGDAEAIVRAYLAALPAPPPSDIDGLCERNATWLESYAQDCRETGDLDQEAERLDQAASALRSLKAERDEMRKALGWQPIETAPKDGTRILVSGCTYGPLVRIAEWGSAKYLGRKKGWENGWFDHPGHSIDPIHWMPIPLPRIVARALTKGEAR